MSSVESNHGAYNMIDILKRVLKGLEAADAASTPAGRTKFGWIRLGRVASLTGRDVKPYVIAIRARTTEPGVQLGCSCPDWMYRKRHTKDLCKHQHAFLRHEGGSSPKTGLWVYRAGAVFLAHFQGHPVVIATDE